MKRWTFATGAIPLVVFVVPAAGVSTLVGGPDLATERPAAFVTRRLFLVTGEAPAPESPKAFLFLKPGGGTHRQIEVHRFVTLRLANLAGAAGIGRPTAGQARAASPRLRG